ncbi:MAG: cytochrome C oxidase subunit IV family protein [Pirellulaceae bacterium]
MSHTEHAPHPHQADAEYVPLHADHDHGMGHVMPIPVLLGTFCALISLTIVTVWSSQFDLGKADLWVAMAIATVKAILVAVYFMHLRYDKTINVLIFTFSLLFVGLFVWITVLDRSEYQGSIQEYQQQNPPAAAP